MTRVALGCPICVDFKKVGEPEYLVKNPRSPREINDENSYSREMRHIKLGFSGEMSSQAGLPSSLKSTHVGHIVAR